MLIKFYEKIIYNSKYSSTIVKSKITEIHSGDKIHNQDQFITLNTFNIINIKVKIKGDILTTINFFFCIIYTCLSQKLSDL